MVFNSSCTEIPVENYVQQNKRNMSDSITTWRTKKVEIQTYLKYFTENKDGRKKLLNKYLIEEKLKSYDKVDCVRKCDYYNLPYSTYKDVHVKYLPRLD